MKININKYQNFKNRFKENKYEPKFNNENAFTKKLKEFHNEESLNSSQYKIGNSNKSLFEDRKIERDLTPKEKKIFEQNPKMSFYEIKKIGSKPENQNQNEINNKINISSKNNTLFNKVSFNHSNIFNDTVFNLF
jgi:hypothetical protein